VINFVQPGDSLTLTAPGGGVVSGNVYLIGVLLVVAAITAAATEPFTCMARGVFDVPKAPSQAWTEGAAVYWDAGNSRFTTTAGGNTLAGVAVLAVGSGAGETTGRVFLNGYIGA
jgi:predicted RecA/RadA family phage recombinase